MCAQPLIYNYDGCFLFDYFCPHCGIGFLPMIEDGMRCPQCYCKVCPEINPPGIYYIVTAAWKKFVCPSSVWLCRTVGDAYVLEAFKLINFLFRAENIPDSDEEITLLAEKFLAETKFSGTESHKKHIMVFIKRVIKKIPEIIPVC